jgi:hypothetical protein
MRRRSVRRAALLSAGALALLSGCASDSTGYSGPMEAEVRRAIPAIEEATGLTFKEPPVLEMRTRDELREFLERQFNEQLTPLEIAGVEQTYKLLGLIPDSMDLRQFLLDLLTEQVAGYYDPDTKVLYVLEDGAAEITSITVSHELVHALQDQYLRLDSARSLKGDNDRQVAMQAVIEGHAMYEQLSSMLGGDLGLRMPGGWDRVRDQIRSEQGSTPLFANAPMIIQETLLFPYLSGAEFIRQVKRERPGPPAFEPVASSTEQILHPERFLSDPPDVPTRITLPAPRGASLVHEDNLGEFEMRLFLYEHLRDLGTAARAAEGWDGDRYQLVNTSRGAGLAWFTVWDSAVEAAEFRDVMERMIERRFSVTTGTGRGDAARSWTARGRRLTLAAETVEGRPTVTFEDLPAGVTTRVLRTSEVRLEQP